MPACECSERKRPLPSDLPAGSNERPRQWFVWTPRNTSCSAFNGYRPAWSAFSWVECRVCGSAWKTKGAFVDDLPDCDFAPERNAPRVPAWEALA